MSSIDFVETKIAFDFEQIGDNNESFLDEFYLLQQRDSITRHIKNPKLLSEATEGEMIIIELLGEIFNRLDKLESIMTQAPSDLIELSGNTQIVAITHEYFELADARLKEGTSYYGRFEMPIYPRKTIGLFFVAESDKIAKINRIHSDDEASFSSFVMSLVRAKIRRIKGL